ncbi:hypothetical protein GOHSU_04_01690 [Gordonia hirsuta DSM 44140 = NBRC 16056]|uniref:Ferredoxin n=1 Tax=Gordonia hirsuta DSM 44140 = NBRC 16056 TaxID=1121927 RepID=L7L5S7_9ACTN|nr:(2Fe-2S) ferredoxin domain-containing protein [Gordonia hirsuta]GAC56299.1 hypothetical protein GOHSU_04_01690 [Gordonia hirsuta DSM 44140 = NBRC 16056]
MTIDWIIITAPTDRGGLPAPALERAVVALTARRPQVPVRVAVLGGTEVPITEALDEAATAGARCVLLVSGQTLGDTKQDAWCARLVGHWLRTRPAGSTGPQVRIAPLLTEHDGYAELLEAAIAGGGVPARQTTAPIQSPAWENVPGFARHVLVCRGPRCSVEGARESSVALAAALAARDLGDDQALQSLTGCLFPCGQAPVMVVYPDGVWYSGMRPDRVEQLVERHLVGDTPVPEWIARQMTPAATTPAATAPEDPAPEA